MTPEQLKASILQYAIQGKLVEQRPEEGTAEELYQEIQKELVQLVKEKKFKVKDDSPIIEEEIPFDIPYSWKWVRLGQIINIESGKGLTANQMKSGNIPVYGGNGVTGSHNEALIHKRTIVIGRVGFYCGSVHVTPDEAWVTDNAFITTYPEKNIHRDFLVYILRFLNLGQNSNATAQPVVSGKKIYPLLIPLPPLNEQRRIVSKIEELLPYVDRYAEAYEKLEQFNTKFPEDMKKSILQYAIQGKLVEQRPEEGTAEELYQQIQKEKQKLIKEGKIKKEKPLPEITEDEIPFEIPESWKWCYIGELFIHNTGKAQNSSGSQNGTVRKFITTSNLYWNEFDFTKVKEMPFTDQELERCTVKKGDLLVCEGGDCGRSAVWNYDEEVCIQNHVHRLRTYIKMNVLYFYYIFYFYKNTGKLHGRGVAIQGLSNEAMHRILVPVPPLEEQYRIVKKIEELLPYCDKLSKE